MSEILLKNAIKTNTRSYQKTDNWEYINYLDTGNLTENKISEIVQLNPNIDKIPSRAKRKVKIGDIIYSTVRPNQKHYGYIDKEYDNLLVSTGYVVIEPNDKIINGKYLYYFLTQDSIITHLQTIAENTVATYPSISPKDIEDLVIDLPELNTQRKIAKVLSSYDDLIENNNKRIKILEEMAQKIYKEWFVDFKFPNHETATFKQTALGKIPTDWEINKLSDFGETITGKTPSKNDDSNYGKEIPFIKTPDMHNGIFCLDTIEHLSLKGANTQKNKFIPIGSICVSCIGTVGVVAITTKNSQTNQQINSVIPKNNFYREYLYFVCNNLKPTLKNLGANGATMTNVNKNKFDNIQVAKPSDKLLQDFSQLLKPIFEQIKNLSLKNQTLKQTRDLLLPRLISSEIDVENMELCKFKYILD